MENLRTLILVFLALPLISLASPLQPPRSIYEVLDAQFLKEKLGYGGPTLEIALPFSYKIQTVKVPWAVKGNLTQVVAVGDLAPVQDLVSKSGLQAVRMNGQAVLMLYFLNYEDSGAGPYEEFVLGYLAHKPSDAIPEFHSIEDVLKGQDFYKDKIMNFVQHLTLGGPDENFVNFHHAIWAGRVAISYPKYYGRSHFERNPLNKTSTITVDQPEAPYFTQNQIDSSKAGSMRLQLKVKKSNPSRSYFEKVYTDFHTTPTVNNKLCTMGNRIYVEAQFMNQRPEDIQLTVQGQSSTAQFLNHIHVKPMKAIYARNLKTFMFPKESADNDCRGGTGLPFNYQNFYPARLLK